MIHQPELRKAFEHKGRAIVVDDQSHEETVDVSARPSKERRPMSPARRRTGKLLLAATLGVMSPQIAEHVARPAVDGVAAVARGFNDRINQDRMFQTNVPEYKPEEVRTAGNYQPTVTLPSLEGSEHTYTAKAGDTIWGVAADLYPGDGNLQKDYVNQVTPMLDGSLEIGETMPTETAEQAEMLSQHPPEER